MATSVTGKTRISSRGNTVDVKLSDLSKSWGSNIRIYQLNLLMELKYCVFQEASKNLEMVFRLNYSRKSLRGRKGL